MRVLQLPFLLPALAVPQSFMRRHSSDALLSNRGAFEKGTFGDVGLRYGNGNSLITAKNFTPRPARHDPASVRSSGKKPISSGPRDAALIFGATFVACNSYLSQTALFSGH